MSGTFYRLESHKKKKIFEALTKTAFLQTASNFHLRTNFRKQYQLYVNPSSLNKFFLYILFSPSFRTVDSLNSLESNGNRRWRTHTWLSWKSCNILVISGAYVSRDVCITYVCITWRKQFKQCKVFAVVGSMVLVGALIRFRNLWFLSSN